MVAADRGALRAFLVVAGVFCRLLGIRKPATSYGGGLLLFVCLLLVPCYLVTRERLKLLSIVNAFNLVTIAFKFIKRHTALGLVSASGY